MAVAPVLLQRLPFLPPHTSALFVSRRASPFLPHPAAVFHQTVSPPSPLCHSPPVSAKQSPSNVSRGPSKNLLRAREAVKEYSSLAPILSPDDLPSVSPTQAVGMVVSAQANFMRVLVQSVPFEASRKILGEGKHDSGSHGTEKAIGIGVELLCVVRAVLKKIKRWVMVGDKVLVGSINWVERRGMIENVFNRKSVILDPPVANVDHLLVLFSMEQPQLGAFALTRFLVEAESTGLPVTLALNKSELAEEEALMSWKSRLLSWGYKPIFCSVDTKRGLDTLALTLCGRTSVIVGPSGVGKSSLINVLRRILHLSDASEDHWFDHILGSRWLEDQLVGEVSKKSGSGKHTTRNVSLLPLPEGGYIADTPGFNQPSLINVTKRSLENLFPEIRKMLSASEPEKCAFKDCFHLTEPGCVLKGDWERYPYYMQLFDEIKIREDVQLRLVGTKRESDVRYKMRSKGVKEAEPKLDKKKHRRPSRKRMNQSLLDELDALEELDDDR